jgi:hypothetical protein
VEISPSSSKQTEYFPGQVGVLVLPDSVKWLQVRKDPPAAPPPAPSKRQPKKSAQKKQSASNHKLPENNNLCHNHKCAIARFLSTFTPQKAII